MAPTTCKKYARSKFAWRTGKRVRARANKKTRMALFDIQVSAPKDVSVLAIVGGDYRVREAFVESVRTVLVEMEQYAAVRERRGEAGDTEAFRVTGNFVGALFIHDASRDLDPQLHGHAVLANATCDGERSRWMALQHAEMMRASPFVMAIRFVRASAFAPQMKRKAPCQLGLRLELAPDLKPAGLALGPTP
jgi:conjugative relaxase-like TrwC/TraI family protein